MGQHGGFIGDRRRHVLSAVRAGHSHRISSQIRVHHLNMNCKTKIHGWKVGIYVMLQFLSRTRLTCVECLRSLRVNSRLGGHYWLHEMLLVGGLGETSRFVSRW